jgi:DNA-directed RNA polymerase specialized sigma24 family protein
MIRLAKTALAEYEPVVRKIANKYAPDADLAADAMQEARIALATLDISNVRSNLDSFVRMVIRNSVLSTLNSYNTGDWYSGRTRQGEQHPARYIRIDALMDMEGVQISEDGQLLPGVDRFDQDADGFNYTFADGGAVQLLYLGG